MQNLRELLEDYQRAPRFNFLYLNLGGSRASQFVETSKRWNSVDKAVSLEASQIGESLRLGKFNECLIIVVDIGDTGKDGLSNAVKVLSDAEMWSPQCCAYVVTESKIQLDWQEVKHCINHRVCSIGTPSECESWLQSVVSETCESPLCLWRSGPKEPRMWIRSIAHDYLANTVNDYALQSISLEDERVAQLSQRVNRIKTLQSLLRLIFLDDDPRTSGAPSSMQTDKKTVWFVDQNTQCQAIDSKVGEYNSYSNLDEIEGVLRDCVESSDRSPVLIRRSDTDLPNLGSENLPIPNIIVDSAPNLSWADWQRSRANNLIAAVSVDQLLTQRYLARIEAITSAFTTYSIPQLFEEIISEMVVVHNNLHSDVSESFSRDQAMCMIQVLFAKGLYLGNDAN